MRPSAATSSSSAPTSPTPPPSDGQANLTRYRTRQQDEREPSAPQPTVFRCLTCGEYHQPTPQGGTGAAGLYGRPILPDPGRPEPLNRQADELPLELLRHRPWT